MIYPVAGTSRSDRDPELSFRWRVVLVANHDGTRGLGMHPYSHLQRLVGSGIRAKVSTAAVIPE
jgi:hypothetical protein